MPKLSAKCFVFHLISSEVEYIMNLNLPVVGHTLHHIECEKNAFSCGGRNNDGIFAKECLVFNILNQKFKNFGQLNIAR